MTEIKLKMSDPNLTNQFDPGPYMKVVELWL